MTKRPLYISRRQLVRGMLATSAFGIASQLWTACTPSTPTPSGSPAATGGGESPSPSPANVSIGFIFVGPKDDFGWNQSHYEGEQGIAKLPGVKTVDEASVAETKAVEETMLNMIEQDGVTVLFPTSYGYFDPYILNLAKKYPNVQFFNAGGRYEEGKTPKNIGSYFGYIDEGQYISGIVAAHMSKSGKLGFVAAKPIPHVLRNINSFTLGARSIKPDITTQVVFTGDWSLPVKEAEATNGTIDWGADVVTCHVDSPKVVMETAEKRGIYCCGYHTNQAALAPKGYLTGAEWDWTSVYTGYVKALQEGKTLMNGGIPNVLRGGLKEGFCKMSPFGAAVSEAARKDAEAALAKFMDGTAIIYQGEIKDNKGKAIVPKDKALKQTDPILESMDWLVEGVVGSTSS